MTAAVVEFDALSDSVRSAAENEDFRRFGRSRFVFALVGGVIVRRNSFVLAGARVDQFADGVDALIQAAASNVFFRNAEDFRQTVVGKAHLFRFEHFRR